MANLLLQLEPFAEYGVQFLVIFLLLPILLPVFLLIAAGALAWSVVFKLFKVEYNLTITREALPPKEEAGRVTTPDGVEIRYCTSRVRCQDGTLPEVDNGRVVLFCNPLGQKGLQSWGAASATAAQLWGPGSQLICWDYRGFFESECPKRLRSVDVRNHAEDALVVLQEVVGDRPADLVMGHSMGVQVALEFTLLYPEKVGSLILLNGTYGHALQTAFQPLLRLPYVGGIVSSVFTWLLRQNHEWILEMIRRLSEPFMGLLFQFLTLLFGSRSLEKVYGKDYMLRAWQSYLGGICSNTKSMRAFLRGFQDLDAHSTGHLLHEIGHPTLLIAGIWDGLTPPYNMIVMRREMQNARFVLDGFSGHFTVMEHPELVMSEMAHFLLHEVPKYKRAGSCDFSQSPRKQLKEQ